MGSKRTLALLFVAALPGLAQQLTRERGSAPVPPARAAPSVGADDATAGDEASPPSGYRSPFTVVDEADVARNGSRPPRGDAAAEALLPLATSEPVSLVAETFPVGTVSGSVVDAWGLAVARADLVVYSARPGARPFTVRTDTAGGFVADGVAAGRVTLAVDGPAYVPVHAMSIGADESVHVQIVLERRWHSMYGRVSDAEGTALGDAVLHFEPVEGASPASIDWWSRTEADGTFASHVPSLEPYRLVVRVQGFKRYSRIVEPPSEYLDVRLEIGT